MSPDTTSARIAAAAALARLGSDEGFAALKQFLADSDKNAREAAVEAMGATGDKRAVQPLLNMLILAFSGNAPGKVPVERVLSALGRLGDPRAITPLLEVLMQKGLTLVDSAALALSRLGALGLQEAIDGLIDALRYRDPGRRKDRRAWCIRKAAARGLIELAATDPTGVLGKWQCIGHLVREPHDDSHGDRYPDVCTPHEDTHRDVGIGLPWREKFVVACPNPQCKTRLAIPMEHVGKRGRCPDCGRAIDIAEISQAPGTDTPSPDF